MDDDRPRVGISLMVAAVLSGCGSTQPQLASPTMTHALASASAAAPSSSPSATTGANEQPANAADWLVTDLEVPTHAVFWDVIGDGERLVAVGQRIVDGTYWYPAAWTSVDGVTWADASLPVRGGGQATALAWSEAQGYVALGGDADGARIWHSADGTTWVVADAEVALDPFADGGPVMTGEFCCGVDLQDVAVGPTGYTAVGSAGDSKTSPRAAILTSPDGLTWTRVPYSEALVGGGMTSIAHVPSIGWVANGGFGWRSLDGVSWSRGDRFEIDAPLLAAVEGTLVGVRGWDGTFFSSTDGMRWLARNPSTEERSDTRLTEVMGTDAGILAVGHRGKPYEYTVVLWLSEDGRRWTHEVAFDGGYVSSPPLVMDDTVVLYESTESHQVRSWSVPISTLEHAPAPPPTVP